MKQIFFRYILGITALGIASFCVASTVSAQSWSGPTVAPTGGNTATPLNVSNIAQTKTGVLYVFGVRSYVDGIFDGKVGVGSTSPYYTLDVNGQIGAGAFFYTSDRSLKKNIKPLERSLDAVTKLQGVSFDWKKDGTKSVGLVAQDVEAVYPELVSTNTITGIKSVEYGNLVAPLIEAVKEQQKQIEILKQRIEILEKQ